MSSENRITSTREHHRLSAYGDLLNSLPAAVYVCDADGYITAYNEAAVRLWGRRPEIGKDLWCGSWKIYDLDDVLLPLDSCPMAETLKSGKAITGHEIIIEQPGGARFNVLPYPTPLCDDNGMIIGAINMLVDVTHQSRYRSLEQRTNELKKTAEQLQRSEERYHRMIEEVQDYAILLLSKDGIIQNWNKGAEKIKGYSAQEAIGQSFRIFYPTDDLKAGLPEKLIQIAAKEGKANHEGWRLRKDGTRFWGSVAITALHSKDGALLGFTKVTRDLTDKKIAEERLTATSQTLAERNSELVRINEELSSFAYISSHDLQEPLRKIQTFADRIMEMEYENLSEKGKDYFRRMQAGAARMQKLIRDILAYSRTTTADKKFELTDLNELLAHAKVELEVLITEKKAVIVSDPLPEIEVIPFQVQQLFNNLLNNALKFSKPDVPPRVVIRSAVVEGKSVPHLHPPVLNAYCHITFQDNGIGFEPEYSKKIFEVFQRLHGRHEYGGTGIGLAICKKIVENHNGVISAESIPGEGATFHVYLPLREKKDPV